MLSGKKPAVTVAVLSAVYLVLEVIVLLILFILKNFIIFLILHAVVSAAASAAISLMLKKKVEEVKKLFLVSTLLLFCIPAGGLFLTAGIYFILKTRKVKSGIPVKNIDIDNILNEFIQAKPRKFGEGALKLIPRIKKKEETLLFLTDLLTPFSVEIARKFLKERDYEVRLGAFSILVKLEKRLNNRISELMELYQKEKDRYRKGAIAREIASYYWELLYFNLADRELEKFIVEEALRYATTAFEILKDTQSAFIIGRVLLRQKRYKEAEGFLRLVYQKGNLLERNRVIPYLAEVEFFSGNYRKVKELFRELPYSIYPEVHFKKVFWSGSGSRNP